MQARLELKSGVRLHGIEPEMIVATLVLQGIWGDLGAESLTITTGIEGSHTDYSDHYQGNALDYRTRNIPRDVIDKLVPLVQERLGFEDFFVLLEGKGTPNEHLHVSYRPKGAY